jgi:hypothetical protein
MNLRQRLEQRIARLRAHPGAKVERCHIADSVAADDVEAVVALTGAVPASLLDFYRQMNGVELGWTLQEAGHDEIVGSLDFLPMRQALLGMSTVRDGEPFEGVLWNDEYPEAALKRLKKMRVLESTAGEPSFITFVPDEQPLRLYRVDEATIMRICPDFPQALALLVHGLGCAGLRETLTHQDCERRIRASAFFAPMERL